MDNYVHVDEKWFFLKATRCTFYGVTGETPPPRSVKNKNYILKWRNIDGTTINNRGGTEKLDAGRLRKWCLLQEPASIEKNAH
ncbi:hypothetical protein H310_08876 [Aphanomyces invadans]|uniref:Uncharacterized protein n=1 Tax=Aphanomyces invadans TaxID=157072 RepID=A0A024TVS2_9STRA|nr:hypothetical protein H310_08876 [Aphanomyces invadans]ETV98133.1 hypothetical protein H310_08876 [Aphanomyces invadans]|eukprot:XP_008873008.1 hypothetical protein H310_08876 [Aphanomyces invadans]